MFLVIVGQAAAASPVLFADGREMEGWNVSLWFLSVGCRGTQ
jgi:hypothetical protein